MRAALLASLALLGSACAGGDDDTSAPAWMSGLADDRGLTELSIPGTHDSGALFEPIAGIAQCQRLTIAEQLDAGVRYFDIRGRHLGDALAIYHGPVDEEQTFDDVLATMTAFLDANPTETVIMSLKEEWDPDNSNLTYEQVFASYVARDPVRWYLDDAVPALGDARGKIVLVRRFAATATTPLGIDASAWADNTTFTLDDPHAMLRIEDAYMVGMNGNAAKWTAIASLLGEARVGPPDTMYLTYTSGYQTVQGIPNVPDVASEINIDLVKYLHDGANAHTRTGVLAMDLVDALQVHAVVDLNTYVKE